MKKRFLEIIKNLIYYLQISIKIKRSEIAVICPYGIGDTYFVCSLLKQFRLQNDITKIVLIIKQKHIGISKLFSNNIDRIITVDKFNLKRLSKVECYSRGKIIIAHPLYFKGGILLDIMGYKNINLLEIYRLMLRMPINAAIEKPVIPINSERSAKKKFDSMKLIKKRTVILAPTANSVNQVIDVFWEKLAYELKKNMWTVCTNLNPGDSKVIKGTIPIFFELDEAITISELSGWVISMRSGLCDLISTSNCKLTVIYPNQTWYGGTVFTCSSLNNMGISDSVDEIIFDENEDIDLIVRRIIYE